MSSTGQPRRESGVVEGSRGESPRRAAATKDGRRRPGQINDTCLQSALAYHRIGRTDDAARLYGEILERRPRHAEALHYYGVLLFQRGEHETAITSLKRSVRSRPERPEAHCDLGEIQRAAGRLADAEASCRHALELRPAYPEALVNLAAVLFQQRRYAESASCARDVLALNASFPPAMLLLADSLREQQDLPGAEDVYRQLLAIQPGHPAALANLGWMQVQRGNLEEGLQFCRLAAGQPAANVLPLLNLARALFEFGRYDEAMAVLERALKQAPNDPQISLLIGVAWDELGEFEDARNWFDRALQLDDKLVEARVHIAGLEADRDNHPAALEMLEAVLADNPRRVDALVAKAKSKLALGDVDGAVETHRAAIELSPQSAGLHAALGATLASAGDLDAAVACQRHAIKLNERCVPAYAGLLTTLRNGASDAERDAATALLDTPWMTDLRRASLRFGLATYYDGRGEWEEAAHQMVAANALRKAADERRNRAYDAAQYEAFVDGVISNFTPDLFARLRGMGSESERPVFVVGMPRSGTTLAEQILASHPQVFGAGERPFASQGLRLLPHVAGCPEADPLACLATADRSHLHAVADWHLEQLTRLDRGRELRVVDKMPDNYQMLGWLAVLFPRARFIYCRRDPRDVALSCWITNFASIRWATDLGHLTHRLEQHFRLMRHWQQVLPVPMLEVDYESMVADQEGESRRLVQWLGLDWDERCLSFYKTERLVRTASVAQVREPIYRRSVERWRHYESMLAPLIERLASSGDLDAGPT